MSRPTDEQIVSALDDPLRRLRAIKAGAMHELRQHVLLPCPIELYTPRHSAITAPRESDDHHLTPYAALQGLFLAPS